MSFLVLLKMRIFKVEVYEDKMIWRQPSGTLPSRPSTHHYTELLLPTIDRNQRFKMPVILYSDFYFETPLS